MKKILPMIGFAVFTQEHVFLCLEDKEYKAKKAAASLAWPGYVARVRLIAAPKKPKKRAKKKPPILLATKNMNIRSAVFLAKRKRANYLRRTALAWDKKGMALNFIAEGLGISPKEARRHIKLAKHYERWGARQYLDAI